MSACLFGIPDSSSSDNSIFVSSYRFFTRREEKQTKGIYRQLDANYFTHTGSQIIIYIYLHVDTLVRVVYHKIGTLKAKEVHWK